ncbi:inner membrane CreD family protein [Roseomonas elaeocarpi]|uniref:Inner membrane CreD family protein n=1 Tax=Roseomonas elaeocarpi TaxID=907779 RepID=A0ABV6JMT0_9PROT
MGFLTYVLFELLAGVGIHLVQYGLLGLSIVLFPLLLLAFGEPVGFAAAYAISTAAMVGQASAYTAGVTRRMRLAAPFAGVLGVLFGFLYVVLNLEADALLVGAVALFAALSVVMMVTRHVDWSKA